MHTRYAIGFTLLLYVILILHLLALYFFWYWTFWWFDIVMHTLGGMWVAGQAWWGYTYWRYRKAVSKEVAPVNVYWVSLVSVLVIGVLWEIFELSLDVYIIFKQNDILDTITDIGADIAGGLIAALSISRYEHRKKDT